MKLRCVTRSLIGVLVVLLISGRPAATAEIKVISLVGWKPLMAELAPQFESAAGHKLAIRYGSAAEGKQRIEAGETFDLAILNQALIEELTQAGKIAGQGRTQIFRNGTGVVVRAGARKPDISTVETFKRALINASSIAYSPGRASGIHVAKILEQLGLSEQMKSKTNPQPAPERVAHAIAEGEAELGFAAMNLLIGVPGAELLGPIPAELQEYIVFTAGLSAGALPAVIRTGFTCLVATSNWIASVPCALQLPQRCGSMEPRPSEHNRAGGAPRDDAPHSECDGRPTPGHDASHRTLWQVPGALLERRGGDFKFRDISHAKSSSAAPSMSRICIPR